MYRVLSDGVLVRCGFQTTIFSLASTALWALQPITNSIIEGLDTTIAASIQGEIYQTLGEIEKLSWVGVGFPMGSVATLVLFGQCYGTFQMKWLYFWTIALFEVGSAICGAAPNMETMIVGRVLTGIGGGGMYIGCALLLLCIMSGRN